jgi:hypothetical protein
MRHTEQGSRLVKEATCYFLLGASRVSRLCSRWSVLEPAGDRHGLHSLDRIVVQGEMFRTSGAQPKMFAPAQLSPVRVEVAALFRNQSFCQEKLALAQ